MTAYQEVQEQIDELYEQIQKKENELNCLTEKYKELCNRQFLMITSFSSEGLRDADFNALAGF
jgi:cell division protein FtsL